MEAIKKSIRENEKQMNAIFAVEENYDVLCRVFTLGDREACFYFIDGFVKDDILQKILQFFSDKKPEDVPENAEDLVKQMVPYGETELLEDFDEIKKNLLSGVSILFVDGEEKAIAVDCRTYPARSVEEPDKDKVLRGSKDGFVETIVFNTALIRRRIRTPELRMEMFSIGKSSRTDVVVSYMADRVNKKTLDIIKEKLKRIQVDALTMNQESLAECLCTKRWLNPFPKFKFSERPDAAAASILEGSIVVLVDNSPSCMIVPTSIFDIIEDADDYYFPPITGTYLRLSRFVINIFAVLLTPTFLLLLSNPGLIPDWLNFIQIKDPVNIPVVIQLLMLEFAIDGLRLASLSTPSMLSTPLSVVAGIVLGDFTVSSGWFNSEVMLYMAFVAIANYTQSNFELGYALKFMRILLLILTAVLGGWGYAAGIIITILAIACNRTAVGRSYLYPLIPFNGKQLMKRLFRISLKRSEGISRN